MTSRRGKHTAMTETRGPRWWSWMRLVPAPEPGRKVDIQIVRLGTYELEAQFTRLTCQKSNPYFARRITQHYYCNRHSWDRLRRVMLKELVTGKRH